MFRSSSSRRLAVLVPLVVVALLVAAVLVAQAAGAGNAQARALPAQQAAAPALGSSQQMTPTMSMTETGTLAALTASDLDTIIQQALTAAESEQSLVRVDAQGNPATVAMQIVVVDRNGRQLRFYGMPDAWVGSIDIAIGKAHTAVYFSSNQNALTSRSVGALSGPGGDLWHIGNSNMEGPVGLIEFAGGLPLYKNGVLVGAIGVSGDGVDQDEAVAVAGAKGFEPPAAIRIDTVTGGSVPYTATATPPSAAATATPSALETATPAATSVITGMMTSTPTPMAMATAEVTPTLMVDRTPVGVPEVAITSTMTATPSGLATPTGSATPSASTAPAVVMVDTASAAKFGTILVGPNGMSLYVFAKDSPGTSTCTGGCATAWPPLLIADGGTTVAGSGVGGVLSIIDRPDGTYQVAYNGMPLYYWQNDKQPGDVTGDGVGGVWSVAKP